MQRPRDGMAAAAGAAKAMNVIKAALPGQVCFSIKDLFDLFFSLLNLRRGQISFPLPCWG